MTSSPDGRKFTGPGPSAISAWRAKISVAVGSSRCTLSKTIFRRWWASKPSSAIAPPPSTRTSRNAIQFASAAVRAQKAGFDGVDINAASSHLLHNFLSPFWNKRQDAYGGSPENRARFVTEIIKEIKKRLGRDFPVSVCINGIEIGRVIGVGDDKCLTPEDSRGTAQLLQEAGADAIQVRNHWLGYHVGGYLPDALFYPEPPIPLKSFPKEYDWSRRGAGANIILAAGIKKVSPFRSLLSAGWTLSWGEKILREGKADFIGMTRRLIADPELPHKIASGRIDDIAPCTACDNCLGSRRCRINALLGTDYNTIEKAERRKKVVVVGGGPAGMEAARWRH